MESEISSEGFDPLLFGECAQRLGAAKSRVLGGELRSHDAPMLDQIPTEVTSHCKAPTDGVSSSDMLGSSLLATCHR